MSDFIKKVQSCLRNCGENENNNRLSRNTEEDCHAPDLTILCIVACDAKKRLSTFSQKKRYISSLSCMFNFHLIMISKEGVLSDLTKNHMGVPSLSHLKPIFPQGVIF